MALLFDASQKQSLEVSFRYRRYQNFEQDIPNNFPEAFQIFLSNPDISSSGFNEAIDDFISSFREYAMEDPNEVLYWVRDAIWNGETEVVGMMLQTLCSADGTLGSHNYREVLAPLLAGSWHLSNNGVWPRDITNYFSLGSFQHFLDAGIDLHFHSQGLFCFGGTPTMRAATDSASFYEWRELLIALGVDMAKFIMDEVSTLSRVGGSDWTVDKLQRLIQLEYGPIYRMSRWAWFGDAAIDFSIKYRECGKCLHWQATDEQYWWHQAVDAIRRGEELTKAEAPLHKWTWVDYTEKDFDQIVRHPNSFLLQFRQTTGEDGSRKWQASEKNVEDYACEEHQVYYRAVAENTNFPVPGGFVD